MAASGGAAAPDMSQYITRDEAQSEIGRLVKEQLEAFSAQREVIAEQSRKLEEQSREAPDISAKLAIEVDAVLKSNKTECEAQKKTIMNSTDNGRCPFPAKLMMFMDSWVTSGDPAAALAAVKS